MTINARAVRTQTPIGYSMRGPLFISFYLYPPSFPQTRNLGVLKAP